MRIKQYIISGGDPVVVLGPDPRFLSVWGQNVHRPPLFSAMLLYMACNP